MLIHLLLYPSSNGYNSYMDRDRTAVGGLQNPMQPTRQLFLATVVLDVSGIVLSFFISPFFAFSFFFYIVCSRLYSYRGVRLKRFPVAGYLTVILNQGGLIFCMAYYAATKDIPATVPWQGIVAASFLIGGFYPITQVYQYREDEKDGVQTISMLLGKRGTFVFCAVMYAVAFVLLFFYYKAHQQLLLFIILQIFFVPVIVYFLKWFLLVWKDESLADFKHTMRMNWLAATCTNLAFITIIILKQIG